MTSLRRAREKDAQAVAELLARCEAADGFAPLSEFKALRVPVAAAMRSVIVEHDGNLVAIGVAAWHSNGIQEEAGYWAVEIAIEPRWRSPQMYTGVLEALEGETAAPVSFWTFSDRQREAATAHGMVAMRSLVVMEVGLPAVHAELPHGISVRGFEVGEDEAGWLALNRRVFAEHPEAGSIDAADLELRISQPWFDQDGLLIVMEDDTAIGYCWTKRHSIDLGEIYMIGLVPEARGRGLGRPLTAAGLEYLGGIGVTGVMLYADAADDVAIGLYESMGFKIVRQIALYEAVGDRAVGG